uniref:Uncharacterized protein n=1 Tax=Helianthus annuus TaxID=4232 RepID=A0A251S0C7_HELAN
MTLLVLRREAPGLNVIFSATSSFVWLAVTTVGYFHYRHRYRLRRYRRRLQI